MLDKKSWYGGCLCGVIGCKIGEYLYHLFPLF